MQRCGEQIRFALAVHDHASVRDAAHALKGVSANVGALRCLALANRLMAASRAELEESAERLSLDLGDALQITVSALQREIVAAGGAQSADGTTPL